jgi:hypothetical protein
MPVSSWSAACEQPTEECWRIDGELSEPQGTHVYKKHMLYIRACVGTARHPYRCEPMNSEPLM